LIVPTLPADEADDPAEQALPAYHERRYKDVIDLAAKVKLQRGRRASRAGS
jgi:hypothetical protein